MGVAATANLAGFQRSGLCAVSFLDLAHYLVPPCLTNCRQTVVGWICIGGVIMDPVQDINGTEFFVEVSQGSSWLGHIGLRFSLKGSLLRAGFGGRFGQSCVTATTHTRCQVK